VEKKKVSAKETVADIRSGMSDADLMSKYALSNAGLQSLFDKLVSAGFIDLSEILERTPSFLGTVDVSETFPPAEQLKAEDDGQPFKSRAATRVNAQEAARDIRSGMDDFALMRKYQVSTKGLSSLFNKLMDKGLIQQIELDRRNIGFEHTVALSEDLLTVSAAYALLGSHRSTVAIEKPPYPRQRIRPAPSREDEVKRATLHEEELYAGPKQAGPANRSFKRPWYDKPYVVALLLILVFPLGLYACYRNSSLSAGAKAFAIGACLLLAIGLLIVAFLLPDGLFPPFL
jgi:hypothetical protein